MILGCRTILHSVFRTEELAFGFHLNSAMFNNCTLLDSDGKREGDWRRQGETQGGGDGMCLLSNCLYL